MVVEHLSLKPESELFFASVSVSGWVVLRGQRLHWKELEAAVPGRHCIYTQINQLECPGLEETRFFQRNT